MERIVITIHPAASDAGLLRVADAMAQVIDFLRLYEEADQATESDAGGRVVWRLESASTNSPFTITALADTTNPVADVARVQRVKAEVETGLTRLMHHGERAGWMDLDAMRIARSLFSRNQNGIGQTRIDFGAEHVLRIDRQQADTALRAIAGITAVDIDFDVPDRRAWGEIRAVLVAVGRYYNRPAIQVQSEQYGFVWCMLPEAIMHKFGDERSIRDVWEGKTLNVEGTLHYSKTGKLRIEAEDIHVLNVAPIELEAVLNPDFTSGMDPAEYLRQMNEGLLAF